MIGNTEFSSTRVHELREPGYFQLVKQLDEFSVGAAQLPGTVKHEVLGRRARYSFQRQ